MQFISVRQMRQNSAELWKQLREDAEIILTSNGKPIAVMAGVDEKNVEKFILAFRKARAVMAMEEMHQTSIKAGTDKMSMAEIDAVVRQIRKSRKS